MICLFVYICPFFWAHNKFHQGRDLGKYGFDRINGVTKLIVFIRSGMLAKFRVLLCSDCYLSEKSRSTTA